MAFVGSETDLMTPDQCAEFYRKLKNVAEDQRDDAMRALAAAESKLDAMLAHNRKLLEEHDAQKLRGDAHLRSSEELARRLDLAESRLDSIRSWVDNTNELGMFAVETLYKLLQVPCDEPGCPLTLEHVGSHEHNKPAVVERRALKCGEPFNHEDNYISTCDLPRGHDGECRNVFE